MITTKQLGARLEAIAGDLHTLGAALPEGDARAEIFRIRRSVFEFLRDFHRAVEEAKEERARSAQAAQDTSNDPEMVARTLRCLDYKFEERIAEKLEYITFYRSCLDSGDFRKGEDSEFYKRYGVCGGFGDGQRKTTDS